MQYLKSIEINLTTLNDLRNKNILKMLGELLIRTWDDVLICQPGIDIDAISINKRKRNMLEQGRYRDFFTHKLKTSRNQFDRGRQSFRELQQKHSAVNCHKQTKDTLLEKLGVILNSD